MTPMVVVNSDGRDDGGGGDECVCFLMTRFAQAHHGAAGVRRQGPKTQGPKTQRGGRGGREDTLPRGSEDTARHGRAMAARRAPRVRRRGGKATQVRRKKNAMLDGTITVASLLLIGSLGVRKQLGASLKPYFAKLAWF